MNGRKEGRTEKGREGRKDGGVRGTDGGKEKGGKDGGVNRLTNAIVQNPAQKLGTPAGLEGIPAGLSVSCYLQKMT